jgi:hypothetical protein
MLELTFTCERTIYIVLEDHVAINVYRNKLPSWDALVTMRHRTHYSNAISKVTQVEMIPGI